MTTADLATKVVPTGILEMQQTLDLFAYTGAMAARKDESDKAPKLGKSVEKFSMKKRTPIRVEFGWAPYPSCRITGRTVTATTSACHIVIADTSFKKGKHAWKVRILVPGSCISVGVVGPSINRTQGYIGNSAYGWSLNQSGQTEHQGSYHNDNGGSYRQLATGDIINVELDMDLKQLNFRCNTTTWPTMYITLPEVWPAVMVYANTSVELFFD